jgi:hypothetical protein
VLFFAFEEYHHRGTKGVGFRVGTGCAVGPLIIEIERRSAKQADPAAADKPEFVPFVEMLVPIRPRRARRGLI